MASAVLVPVLGTIACYRLRTPAFRSLILAAIVLSGLLPTIQPIAGFIGSTSTIEPAPLDLGTPTTSHDLFIIVLDEYARSDALLEDYEFQNGKFSEALAAQEVTEIPQVWANSSRTLTSLASALSGQYFVEPGQSYNVRDRRRITAMVGGENPLADALGDNGYFYTHIEGPAVDVECSDAPTSVSETVYGTKLRWRGSNRFRVPVS